MPNFRQALHFVCDKDSGSNRFPFKDLAQIVCPGKSAQCGNNIKRIFTMPQKLLCRLYAHPGKILTRRHTDFGAEHAHKMAFAHTQLRAQFLYAVKSGIIAPQGLRLPQAQAALAFRHRRRQQRKEARSTAQKPHCLLKFRRPAALSWGTRARLRAQTGSVFLPQTARAVPQSPTQTM